MSASPHRSTYSANTGTTYPHTFEYEGGITVNPDLQFIPALLKYGVVSGFELFVGFVPYIKNLAISQQGRGDISVGTRCRFLTSSDKTSSAGFQFIWKTPTADKNKGLGTGRSDFDFTLIFSQVRPWLSVDVNMGGLWTGIPNARGFENTVYGDLTLSRPLVSGLSVFVDGFIYGNLDASTTTILGASGLTYPVTPAFIIDGTINIDIKNGPYNWQILIGGTINLSGF